MLRSADTQPAAVRKPIEAGFTAHRHAGGSALLTMYRHLAPLQQIHPDISLEAPLGSGDARPYARLKNVRSSEIRQNAELLAGKGLTVADAEAAILRAVPSAGRILRATVVSADVRSARHPPFRRLPLSLQLDDESMQQIIDEQDGTHEAIADLAGEPVEHFKWRDIGPQPDLLIGFLPPQLNPKILRYINEVMRLHINNEEPMLVEFAPVFQPPEASHTTLTLAAA